MNNPNNVSNGGAILTYCCLLYFPPCTIYTAAIFTKINLQHCIAIGAAGGVNSANFRGKICAKLLVMNCNCLSNLKLQLLTGVYN